MARNPKRSLEETIRLAKVIVENDENRIIVQRVHESRKVVRIQKRDGPRDAQLNVCNSTASNDEMKMLKNKIEELSKALANAEKDTDSILLRNNKLEDYIKLLEEKVDTQSKEIAQGAHQNDSEKADQELSSRVAFYEMLTSLHVNPKDRNRYLCTVKNTMTRIGVKFEFTVNVNQATEDLAKDDMNMHCRPVANAHLLPEYMQSEIDCSHRMAPVMLGDCLQLLYEEK